MPIGPNASAVEKLLRWIENGQLLRFGKALTSHFIPISDFEEAKAAAMNSQTTPGCVNWIELRENADASLYEVGFLDTPEWLKYKSGIANIFSQVATRVETTLPETYLDIIDDVIADLTACAICIAVKGKLDPFHDRLYTAYLCGGWPCGCTGDERVLSESYFNLEGRSFYVFWRGAIDQ